MQGSAYEALKANHNVYRDVDNISELLDLNPDKLHHHDPLFNTLWNLFERPTSSIYAQILMLVSLILSVTAVSALILMTIPDWNEGIYATLLTVEYYCFCYFTFEYIMRFTAAPNRWQFLVSPINVVDLLVILSFLSTNFFFDHYGVRSNVSHSVQTLRILRILKILSISQFFSAMRSLERTIKQSLQMLSIVVVYISIIAILVATVVYLAENYPSGQTRRKGVTSIPLAIYWAYVSLTSVGYGDLEIITNLGRFVSVICCLLSILVIAIPVGIITNNFTEVSKINLLRRRALEHQMINNMLKPKKPDEEPKDDHNSDDTKPKEDIKDIKNKQVEKPTLVETKDSWSKTSIPMLWRRIRRLECEVHMEKNRRMKSESKMLKLVDQCQEYKKQIEFLLLDESLEYRLELEHMTEAYYSGSKFDPCIFDMLVAKMEASNPVWDFLMHPSTKLSWSYTIVSGTMNFVLVLLSVLNTERAYNSSVIYRGSPTFYLENGLMVFFSVDFVLHFIFSPSKWKFACNPLNILDMVIFLPYIILSILNARISVNVMGVLPVFRVFRVLKIIQFPRFAFGLKTLAMTMRQSTTEISILVLYLAVGVTVFSTFVYFAENHQPNSTFTSIPRAMYWSIVTMTTVGYGEMVIQSLPGMALASTCSVFGVMVIALPGALIANNYAMVYRKLQGHREQEERYRRYLETVQNPRIQDFPLVIIETLKFLIEVDVIKHITDQTKFKIIKETKDIANSIIIDPDSISLQYGCDQCNFPHLY